jgi:hypothetical protein
MATEVWVVQYNLCLSPLPTLHIHISPSTSSGQRNCAWWASQTEKSVTLRPQPGGETTKSIRDMWWYWKKIYTFHYSLVIRVSDYWSWGLGFDSRFYHGDFPLKSKIPMVTTVWVFQYNLCLSPLPSLHIHISPSTSSGQRNCAWWASQPQKSVTLRPQPGGEYAKSIRDMWWYWGKILRRPHVEGGQIYIILSKASWLIKSAGTGIKQPSESNIIMHIRLPE